MTDASPPLPDEADHLQFDRAESESESEADVTCAACQRQVFDSYHTINGAVVCSPCRDAVLSTLTGGSGFARLLKASLFGLGAAVLGFSIYYGVMRLANMEIGLISILVGFLVGAAVKKGSEGRGGWVYQLLAMFLTYTAIVASYVGVALPQFLEGQEKKNEQAAANVDPGKAVEKADAPVAAGPKPARPSLVALLTALVLLIGIAYSFPVLVGFSSPIGLFIIAFALWEAWKINKRARLDVQGPFKVGPPARGGPAYA